MAKLVHWLMEECPACGYQEFACGVENPRNYSYWSEEVTCKKCVPSNKACSRRVPRRGAKVVKSKSKVRVGRTRG